EGRRASHDAPQTMRWPAPRPLPARLGADVGEVAQGNPERDRHVVETVDRDRFLAALDLADELPAEPGFLAESLLAEGALFAQGTETLPENFSDALGGASRDGTERDPGARGRRALLTMYKGLYVWGRCLLHGWRTPRTRGGCPPDSSNYWCLRAQSTDARSSTDLVAGS